ncbi:MAG: nucleotidyltransferase domain-containing protein [Melioribacteraceae bacterium]|nr:nucleotidyltransferase domain-containing protein [Melioribacteraceae bacterium]
MSSSKLKGILDLATEYAGTNDEILAIGLCGSWARGNPGPDSDIDLLIIVKDKSVFKATAWLEEIDFNKIQEELDYYKDEVYGRVWSRHVFLKSKTEIEFSFADKSWTDTDHIDPGTIKVISEGYKIIYDPYQLLKNIVHKIKML